jgi:hypothetical protein
MVKLSQITDKPNRILAIDASTTSLAFAVFELGTLEAIGKISFEGNNTYKKVSDSSKKTFAFFSSFDKIDAIVIEHTVFINSPKTAADLALVQGAMLGAASMAGVSMIKSINPIAWQSFIGNNRLTKDEKLRLQAATPGKSISWYKTKEREYRKNRTIKFVNSCYGRNTNDNDVADAIGVGHYAIHNWNKLNS